MICAWHMCTYPWQVQRPEVRSVTLRETVVGGHFLWQTFISAGERGKKREKEGCVDERNTAVTWEEMVVGEEEEEEEYFCAFWKHCSYLIRSQEHCNVLVLQKERNKVFSSLYFSQMSLTTLFENDPHWVASNFSAHLDFIVHSFLLLCISTT